MTNFSEILIYGILTIIVIFLIYLIFNSSKDVKKEGYQPRRSKIMNNEAALERLRSNLFMEEDDLDDSDEESFEEMERRREREYIERFFRMNRPQRIAELRRLQMITQRQPEVRRLLNSLLQIWERGL